MTKAVLRVPILFEVDDMVVQYFTRMYRQKSFNIVSVHCTDFETTV